MTPRHALIRIALLSLLLSPLAAGAQAAPAKPAPATKAQPKAQPAAPLAAASADAALLHRWEVEGALGLAIPSESGVDTGLKLAGSAFYGLQALKPGVVLQIGGTLAWTYNGYGSGVDGSLNTIDLVPTARLRMALDPKLFIYGDGGLGLGFVHGSVTIPGLPAIPPVFPGTPPTTSSSTDVALLLKLGGGIGYEVNPNLSLVAEPAFNIYIKSGSLTQFTLMVGALYRL